MSDYALILGVSSGIGAACAQELASNNINIIGLYMRKPKKDIDILKESILSHNVKCDLIKMNACNYEQMESLLSSDKFKNKKIKILVHSLAFGSMKRFIDIDNSNIINKKNIDMTLESNGSAMVQYLCLSQPLNLHADNLLLN